MSKTHVLEPKFNDLDSIFKIAHLIFFTYQSLNPSGSKLTDRDFHLSMSDLVRIYHEAVWVQPHEFSNIFRLFSDYSVITLHTSLQCKNVQLKFFSISVWCSYQWFLPVRPSLREPLYNMGVRSSVAQDQQHVQMASGSIQLEVQSTNSTALSVDVSSELSLSISMRKKRKCNKT